MKVPARPEIDARIAQGVILTLETVFENSTCHGRLLVQHLNCDHHAEGGETGCPYLSLSCASRAKEKLSEREVQVLEVRAALGSTKGVKYMTKR